MNSAEYERYLDGGYWRDFSASIRKRDGNKCQMCGSTNRLQVHHLTYENCPYHEHESDVVTLCARCHLRVHGTLDDGEDMPEGMQRELISEFRKKHTWRPVPVCQWPTALLDELATQLEELLSKGDSAI